MDELLQDERFAHIPTDPKFRRIRKEDRKVKIDKRFKSLVSKSMSRSQCRIDKRGRPLKTTTKDDFSQFYEFSESEEENEVGKHEKIKGKKPKKQDKVKYPPQSDSDADEDEGDDNDEADVKSAEDTDEEEDIADEENVVEEDTDEEDDDDEENEEEDEEDENDVRSRSPDWSRGIGNVSSSDEEDEMKNSDDEIEADGTAIHTLVKEVENEVPTVEESSHRLAICNLNWDHITAQDLLVLCNSFKPGHGTVFSVTIYPTDFGLERMKDENQQGPKEITDVAAENTAQTAVKKKGKTKDKKMDSEKLRQYELNRLRYYVAVVECDSIETADQIYKSCDGLEFEKTGTKLDFRYIPDDITFEHKPKSVATTLPASGTYKPPHFVDTAQSKTDVSLSWDKTSQKRLAVTQMDLKKVKEIDEIEEQFLEYLAPYTSDEDDDDSESNPYPDLDWSDVPGKRPEKKNVDEIKNLLLASKELEEDEDKGSGKSDDDIDMEITWEIGLKDSLEAAAKEKQKQKTAAKMTPFEQYKQKRKEKRRQKEREKRQKKKNEDDDNSGHVKEDDVDPETFFVWNDEDSGTKNSEKKETKKKREKESLKKRAKKRKREREEKNLEVDKTILSDPRFADLGSKEFAIDPSAPEFNKKRKKF